MCFSSIPLLGRKIDSSPVPTWVRKGVARSAGQGWPVRATAARLGLRLRAPGAVPSGLSGSLSRACPGLWVSGSFCVGSSETVVFRPLACKLRGEPLSYPCRAPLRPSSPYIRFGIPEARCAWGSATQVLFARQAQKGGAPGGWAPSETAAYRSPGNRRARIRPGSRQPGRRPSSAALQRAAGLSTAGLNRAPSGTRPVSR